MYLKFKKFLLLIVITVCSVSGVEAADGDTTWIQANNRRLDNGNGYGPYDTAVVFPSGATTYRKVYMVFNLGEYDCPAGTQYCHQWDYTVTNYIMTPTDTVEISRFITPYATTGSPRFPSTWNKDYVFDVTDYIQYLKGNAVSRIFYSGYSAGFTANVRFAFIEGTPERNVIGIDNLWSGSWQYGNASDPIDNHITPQTRTAPAGAQSAELKVTITGHGADNNYCCEFDSHSYNVLLNNNSISSFTIWKNDCGFNELYPQGGTWIYDRANWCPGEQVNIVTHKLTGVTAGNTYDLDLGFDPYTAGNTNYGSYTVNGAVVYYGAYNHTTDAFLADIIAPTNADDHYRENPFCGDPVIRVANNGSAAITSMKIQYGVNGSNLSVYNWTGNIAASQSQDISLPEPWDLRVAAGQTGNKTFMAKVLEVNGQADEDATNNTSTSTFTPTQKWPVTFIVRFKTNNAANENSWKIYDLSGAVVAQRQGSAANTLYADTLTLGPSCYRLVVEDQGCDGLSWWANPGAGTGLIQVKPLSGSPYTLNGYFGGDFGCGFAQTFTTDWTTTVPTVNTHTPAAIDAFPNPAQDMVTVTLSNMNNIHGTIRIVDPLGKTVLAQDCNNARQSVNISGLASGTYLVVFDGTDHSRIQTRLVITH